MQPVRRRRIVNACNTAVKALSEARAWSEFSSPRERELTLAIEMLRALQDYSTEALDASNAARGRLITYLENL